MAEKKASAKKVVKKKATTTAKKPLKKVVKKAVVKKKALEKKPVSKKTTIKKKVITKKAVTKKEIVKQVVKKEKPARKSSKLGLWSRFYKVFTPTFLTELGEQKSQGKSWGFWFLSNFLLVLIPTIAFFIFQGYFFAGFPDNLVDKIDSDQQIVLDTGESFNIKNLIHNFELSLNADGKLTSKNLPDPVIFLATDESDHEGKSYTSLDHMTEGFAEFAFVLDTKGEFDIENSGKTFANYFYFLEDKAVIYDGKKMQTTNISYKEFMEESEVTDFPKSFSYKDLKKATPFIIAFATGMFFVTMIFLYIFLAIFRILNAIIWALVFWAAGSIWGIKDWNFEKSFMAMLHFSFVTIVFYPLALFLGFGTFINALILLVILFGMNFWEMKKK